MSDEHATVERDGLIRLGEVGYCGEDGNCSFAKVKGTWCSRDMITARFTNDVFAINTGELASGIFSLSSVIAPTRGQ